MSDSVELLERECRVFTEHLLGLRPTPYVVEKYLDALAVHPGLSAGTDFDRVLNRVARLHSTVTRIADAYARVFAPRCLLRKKLVLLLAILEACPPSFKKIESVASVSRPVLLLALMGRGAASVLATLLGAVLFLPLQGLVGLTGRVRRA